MMSNEDKPANGAYDTEPVIINPELDVFNSNEDCNSAAKIFYLISNMMRSIVDGDSIVVVNNDYLSKAIALIDQCLICVDKENMFSRNEEIDDINSGLIKYIFLDYYKGKCYSSMQGMNGRIESLLSAKDAYTSYLQKCGNLRIVHKDDQMLLDNIQSSKQSAETKRSLKIEKFKRDRAAKALIETLQKRIYADRRRAAYQWDDIDGDDNAGEEDLRQMMLVQLQCYFREAIDELDAIQQELILLRFRQQSLEAEQPVPSSGRTSIPPSNHCASPLNQNGPGISVTRTFKVGDQLMFSRDTVKATVFGSHIAAPTMTLEEYGDLQKEEAEARTRDSATISQGALMSRRYNQLHEDGDEDDEELVDQATVKDREWDDWKDNNPKGWGNKLGKRY